jgi:dTDP-4-dehydrorhamnose reductase
MVTLRGSSSDYPADLFDPARTIENVDARDADAIVAAFARARPAVVINCVGIVKQRPEAKDPIASIAVNAMLPHRLAAAADAAPVAKAATARTNRLTPKIYTGGASCSAKSTRRI